MGKTDWSEQRKETEARGGGPGVLDGEGSPLWTEGSEQAGSGWDAVGVSELESGRAGPGEPVKSTLGSGWLARQAVLDCH